MNLKKFILKLLKYLYFNLNFKRFLLFRKVYYRYYPKYRIYKIFHKLIIDKSLILDVGANNGESLNYFNDNFRCNIIAFEPNFFLYKNLKKNFSKYPNILIFNKALGNRDCITKLYLHKNSFNKDTGFLSESASLNKKKNNVSEKIYLNIRMINLKYFLKKIKFIDCIKMNIEGYEYELLPILIKYKHKIGSVVCALHGGEKYPEFESKRRLTYKLLKKTKLMNRWFFDFK
jgi:FkbM family methyltransferase